MWSPDGPWNNPLQYRALFLASVTARMLFLPCSIGFYTSMLSLYLFLSPHRA